MLPDYDTTNNIEKKFNEEIQGQIAEKATPWGLMGTEHEQRLSQCIRHQGDVCGTTDISEEDYKSMPQFIHESLASWMVENKQFSIHGVHSYRESPYENLKRVVNIFKNPFHKRDIFKPDVTETVLKSIAAMSKNSDVIVLCGDRDFYQKVAIGALCAKMGAVISKSTAARGVDRIVFVVGNHRDAEYSRNFLRQAYPGIIVSTYISELRDEYFEIPDWNNKDKRTEGDFNTIYKHIHPYSDAIIVLPETAVKLIRMGRVGSYVVLDNQFNSLESDECVEFVNTALKELKTIWRNCRQYEAVDRNIGRLIILTNSQFEGEYTNKIGMIKKLGLNENKIQSDVECKYHHIRQIENVIYEDDKDPFFEIFDFNYHVNNENEPVMKKAKGKEEDIGVWLDNFMTKKYLLEDFKFVLCGRLKAKKQLQYARMLVFDTRLLLDNRKKACCKHRGQSAQMLMFDRRLLFDESPTPIPWIALHLSFNRRIRLFVARVCRQ